MKKILIAIPFLFVLAGAGYWYFGVYQQEQFAKELVFIYEDTVEQIFAAKGPKLPVRDNSDYAGAKADLAARREYFERAKRKLEHMRPPFFGKGKTARAAFLAFAEKEVDLLGGLEKKAEFLEGATELLGDITTIPAYPAYRRDGAVASMATELRDSGSNIRNEARDLFSIGPVDLNPTVPSFGFTGERILLSYSEIRALWEEVNVYLEEMVKEVSLTQNFEGAKANRWPSTVSRENVYSVVLPFAKKEARQKLDDFVKMMGEALWRSSAKDLVTTRYYVNPEREDQERRQKFSGLIQALKQAKFEIEQKVPVPPQKAPERPPLEQALPPEEVIEQP